MNFIYRISDNSYPKVKLPGATKIMCLENFLQVFSGNNLLVLADNCRPETIQWLQDRKLTVVESMLGNGGSALKAVKQAIDCFQSGPVYFTEDDYLYREEACRIIHEGLRFGSYVTLYDHPDKYTKFYNGGEICRIFKCDWHWRTTLSTCMTFASTVETLKKDLPIFEEYCKGSHPNDHELFKALRGRKKRRLVCAVPGVACHTDLTFSGLMGRNMLESWAVEYAIDLMLKELESQDKDIYMQTRKVSDDRLKTAAIIEMALKKAGD